jgi:hypothetical protein
MGKEGGPKPSRKSNDDNRSLDIRWELPGELGYRVLLR